MDMASYARNPMLNALLMDDSAPMSGPGYQGAASQSASPPSALLQQLMQAIPQQSSPGQRWPEAMPEMSGRTGDYRGFGPTPGLYHNPSMRQTLPYYNSNR